MEKTLFSAEIQELHQILSWIRIHLSKKGLEAKVVRKLELALEEVVVNIINHGYAGRHGKIEIGLKCQLDHVEIVVQDWGPPFNPLANAPKVDPTALPEEREVGGLGIYLVRQIMDELLYAREENANVLTMIKRFSQMT